MNLKRCLSLTLACITLQFAIAKDPVASERDGSTKDKAIVIVAESDFAGTYAKHLYIRQHYPGARLGSSALVHDKEHYYDVDTFTTAYGSKKTLWFDITQNFGKW